MRFCYSAPMRVLVATGLYPPDIGGPATYSKLLEVALPERGIAVTVVPFGTVRALPPIIRHLAYLYRVLRLGRHADVLYAQDTASVGFPVLVANLVLWKKFIVRVPGDHAWEQGTQRYGIGGPLEEFPLWSWNWHPWLMLIRLSQLLVARSAKRVIVPSDYMKRIVATWGVNERNIVRIHSSVTVGDVGEKEVIRGVIHFEGTLLISVGRLVPWKGFDVVIKVFSKLKEKFPQLTLFIAGSGPELGNLERLVAELKLSDAVILAGTIDHDALLRYIKASDVFVLNTQYEGLSHLVLETMAVGTPVVTTNIGGNPEVITDGVNGYLVAPNDIRALQSRISALLEKPATAARISKAGVSRSKDFSVAHMADGLATLLASL